MHVYENEMMGGGASDKHVFHQLLESGLFAMVYIQLVKLTLVANEPNFTTLVN